MQLTRISSHWKKVFWAFILTIFLYLSSTLFVACATANNSNLPDSVAQAVLLDASKLSRLPTDKLSIVDSVQKDWSDGCLGLAQPGTICTQQVVSGWQVKVVSNGKSFIYRTNQSGSIVKLES